MGKDQGEDKSASAKAEENAKTNDLIKGHQKDEAPSYSGWVEEQTAH